MRRHLDCPTDAESILLPCHGIQNGEDIQRKPHADSCSQKIFVWMTLHLVDDVKHPGKKRPLCGKEASHLYSRNVCVWMTIHLADEVKHPGKKRPLCGKDLIRTAQLISWNALLPQNVPCIDGAM